MSDMSYEYMIRCAVLKAFRTTLSANRRVQGTPTGSVNVWSALAMVTFESKFKRHHEAKVFEWKPDRTNILIGFTGYSTIGP